MMPWIPTQVYEAVRSSPLWNNTLLLITYDEHGGFFVRALHAPVHTMSHTPVNGLWGCWFVAQQRRCHPPAWGSFCWGWDVPVQRRAVADSYGPA
jgi:phospholipase C